MTDDSITTSRAPSKKAYHHGDLRQQLVDQAAKMIRDEGEAALSMRKLAAAVGVSRTAPYHHFEDKHALLCAIAEEGFRRFDDLGEGREGITDILDHLQQHIRGYVSFAVECPEYYDLMFSSHIWKSNALTESLRKSSFRTFRLYAEHMAGLCERYELPEGVTPLRFTQVTWSTMHGLSRLMVDGEGTPSGDFANHLEGEVGGFEPRCETKASSVRRSRRCSAFPTSQGVQSRM